MRLFDRIVRFGGDGDHYVVPMFRRLFLPSIIFAIGWALSDIVDAVVVGQRFGATGLAAIGMILPIYAINSSLAHGLGIGGSVRFSRLMAHGDYELAQKEFVQTLLTAVSLSSLFAVCGTVWQDGLLYLLGATNASAAVQAAAREYLTILVAAIPFFHISHILNYFLYNDDNQRLAVLGAVVGNVSDIVLNITLVIVFDLGMRGAAISTVAGQLISISIYLIGMIGREHHLHWVNPGIGFLKVGLVNLRAGFSSSVSYFYLMVFVIVSNNVLIRMGGDSVVAVFDLIQNASYILLYMFDGTSRAVQPLFSTFYGENGRKDLRQTRWLSRFYGGIIGFLLILSIEICPMWMCWLFGISSGETYELAKWALRIYCVGAFIAGINVLDCGYFVACGVDKASLVIQSLRGVVLLLPLTLLGGFIGNVHLFWFVFPLAEFGTWAIFRLVDRFGKWFKVELLNDARIYQKMVNGSTEDVMEADREIETFCKNRGVDAKRCYSITLAVEEICATIVKNGMKDGFIKITLLDIPDGDVILMLRYNDDFFNPFSLQTNMANAEGNFDMDAMGILMIRKQSKDFAYRRYQGLNSLVVRL